MKVGHASVKREAHLEDGINQAPTCLVNMAVDVFDHSTMPVELHFEVSGLSWTVIKEGGMADFTLSVSLDEAAEIMAAILQHPDGYKMISNNEALWERIYA